MRGSITLAGAILLATPFGAVQAADEPTTQPVRERQIESVIDVDRVWSGHPVGFALLTHRDRQFVAYYDHQRRMAVASRPLDALQWQRIHLPEQLGWDSHNYITLAVDDDDHLHLSGNMHGNPLVYFRTTRPLDIASFERVPAMVGQREQRLTYPQFLRGPDNRLLYTYRDGGSGNGEQVFNVYDHAQRRWQRLIDQPLLSGEGKMNAYFIGPTRGPDGLYHLCWVWRDTPDCATNHSLSYACSRDLVNWETSAGKPIPLPITLATGEIVDPVPPGGGIINGNTRIGFDAQRRPVISYHKHDDRGHTQVYNARLEDGHWRIYQASDWDSRWDFSGGGSIRFAIRVSAIEAAADGTLTQAYSHDKHGSGIWQLDPETLKAVGRASARRPSLPKELRQVASDVPGMMVRTQSDTGRGPDPQVTYMLRWETLGPNRDRPREGDPPPPSILRLYAIH